MVNFKAKASTPIATGEFYYNLAAFRTLVDKKVADILQPEAPRCGGVTGWRRIAELAVSHELAVSPCWFQDIHVHLVATLASATFIEYFPDDSVFNCGRLMDRRLQVRDGKVLVPEAPGLGFSLDRDALKFYALST